MSKASKDIAAQGRRVFSTDVVCVLHHTNVFEIPPICGVISSLVLNKALSNRFRGILPAVLTGGFSLTGSSQKLEKPISSLSMAPSTSNIPYWLACVASVSSRGSSRKLGRWTNIYIYHLATSITDIFASS